MDSTSNAEEQETTSLLTERDFGDCDNSSVEASISAGYVLPIALLTALAMASTAATAYFAYATLICRDPAHCEGSEINKYSGLVASATCASNIIGMLALGWLQNMISTRRKVGLQLWIACRTMSAAMLLLGVSLGNIGIALSGRIFEGLASDNLLHFTLNMIYMQCESQEETSALIGYSLALYMTGISVSPFVAGLFKNFTISFMVAICLFAITFGYVQLFVSSTTLGSRTYDSSGDCILETRPPTLHYRLKSWIRRTYIMMISPSIFFRQQPWFLSVGISLLMYNIVQSYIFNALLVHTSTQFGFMGRENGLLISIAHSIAALTIVCNLYIVPYMFQKRSRTHVASDSRLKFGALSVASLLAQSVSVAGLAMSNQGWQIYTCTVILAIGLPAPSFIKSYSLENYKGSNKVAAITALAATEGLGSVLGPFLLGSLQTYTGGRGVFFGASAMLGVSAISFGAGFASQSQESLEVR